MRVHVCMDVGEEEGRVWREGGWGWAGAVSVDMACWLGVGRRRSQMLVGSSEKGEKGGLKDR
jgi:hypothetical protein